MGMEYEERDDGTRWIYRTYNDTEVSELATNIDCPYCGCHWQEYDMSDCGETYELECEDCEKRFKMHFDAS